MLCFKYFPNILNTDLLLLSMQRLKSARRTEGGYVEIKTGGGKHRVFGNHFYHEMMRRRRRTGPACVALLTSLSLYTELFITVMQKGTVFF